MSLCVVDRLCVCAVWPNELLSSSDMPSKTATGTIAIQVTDSNDHCPTLTTTHSSLCSDKKTVYVTAFDEDFSPNAAPFTFTIIPDGTRGSWDIEVINGKTKWFRYKNIQTIFFLSLVLMMVEIIYFVTV